MKHKILAILLCLATVLSVTLPGTLAISMDKDSTNSTLTMDACTCGREDGTHTSDCPLYETTDADEVVTGGFTDYAPPFTTAGPLIKYDTPAVIPASTYSNFSIYSNLLDLETKDLDDAGSGLTKELELNKTVSANDDGSFNITLEAYATGESITTYVKEGMDIVLMLDLSDYMGKETAMPSTYIYTPVDTRMQCDRLTTGTGTYFYRISDENYGDVTVKSSGNSGPNTKYTFTYGSNTKTLTGGMTTLTELGITLYTRTLSSEGDTFYDTDNTEKLVALQTAVNGFIDKVHTQAPASRIAIVTYAGEAYVKSGTMQVNDGALVTVDDSGVAALKEIVNSLSVQGGASNSHYAVADAVKIFQAVPTTSREYSRQRVSILFSAGVPGNGWAESNKSELTTGNSIAQATMTQAYILKSEKGATVTAPDGNVDGGASWSGFSGTDIYQNTVYIGCGATFYSVGLDIPTSGDPANVDMKVAPYKSGALANEYFWRSSSHRLNGTHIFYGYSGSGQYETAINAAFGPTGLSVYMGRKSGTTYGLLYYFYPDSLTRNQTNGYYLTTTSGSADDLANLNKIFDGIAGQIVTDSSTSTTLDEETVIKDIMSDQFRLPDGINIDDISLKTYNFIEMNGTMYVFDETGEKPAGVTAIIDESANIVSVSGFDFSENWCGTSTDSDGHSTAHGCKLVITFTVVPKDKFLGGNNVITNHPRSGVYKDDTDDEPIDVFPQPEANVTIKNNDATIESNVYLGGYYGQTLTGNDIKNNTKITIGGVELDLSKDNYGLEDWQTAYVDIVVTIKDRDGNDYITSELTDDLEYYVTVTIKPKEEAKDTSAGTPNDMSGKDSELKNTVRVFKPELTYKDSTVYYGDVAPTSYNGNLTNTRWVHYGVNGDIDKETEDTDVEMLGAEPVLNITYIPGINGIADNKIATKQDIPVDVTVKIGDWDVTEYVRFIHTKCSGENSCTDPNNGKFWLHVNTCSLTVTKTGGADDEPYVFDVYRDGEKYTEVTVRGNGSETVYELPVGNYTIMENEQWSWRYGADNGSGVVLSAKVPKDEVNCKNELKVKKWLNGFSTIVKNIFGANVSN